MIHRIPASITVLTTIYLWVFQILLCLMVGCVGVSVVWSSQMGILIHHHRSQTSNFQGLQGSWCYFWYYASLFGGFSAWFYYMLIEEPLTTIAHICALVMGVLVDISAQQLQAYRKTLSSATKPEGPAAPLISSST